MQEMYFAEDGSAVEVVLLEAREMELTRWMYSMHGWLENHTAKPLCVPHRLQSFILAGFCTVFVARIAGYFVILLPG